MNAGFKDWENNPEEATKRAFESQSPEKLKRFLENTPEEQEYIVLRSQAQHLFPQAINSILLAEEVSKTIKETAAVWTSEGMLKPGKRQTCYMLGSLRLPQKENSSLTSFVGCLFELSGYYFAERSSHESGFNANRRVARTDGPKEEIALALGYKNRDELTHMIKSAHHRIQKILSTKEVNTTISFKTAMINTKTSDGSRINGYTQELVEVVDKKGEPVAYILTWPGKAPFKF